jgi:hypothetical protein
MRERQATTHKESNKDPDRLGSKGYSFAGNVNPGKCTCKTVFQRLTKLAVCSAALLLYDLQEPDT